MPCSPAGRLALTSPDSMGATVAEACERALSKVGKKSEFVSASTDGGGDFTGGKPEKMERKDEETSKN